MSALDRLVMLASGLGPDEQDADLEAQVAHGETLAERDTLGSAGNRSLLSDKLSLLFDPADGTSAAKLRALSSRWQRMACGQ
jgi:hypothetical protein